MKSLILILALFLTACSTEPETYTEVNLGSCESDVNLTPLDGDNAYGYDNNGSLWYCYCGLDQ